MKIKGYAAAIARYNEIMKIVAASAIFHGERAWSVRFAFLGAFSSAKERKLFRRFRTTRRLKRRLRKTGNWSLGAWRSFENAAVKWRRISGRGSKVAEWALKR